MTVKKTHGQAAKEIKKWSCEEQMQSLKKYFWERETTTNLYNETEQDAELNETEVSHGRITSTVSSDPVALEVWANVIDGTVEELYYIWLRTKSECSFWYSVWLFIPRVTAVVRNPLKIYLFFLTFLKFLKLSWLLNLLQFFPSINFV